MKLPILAFLLTVGVWGCAPNPVVSAHRSTVLLSMDDGTCSGTMIGPHSLLTAEHCLIGSKTLEIDHVPVQVLSIALDHHDHAIVRVAATFTHWVAVRPVVAQGEEIFNLGNPGNLRDAFRHGYVVGQQVMDGRLVYLFDFNGWFGDSGSAIFNDYGDVIAVNSFMYVQVSPQGFMRVMGGFPFGFTDAQWAEART